MNLLLFITVIIVSFIVVRIGAIAFQLTGLEWEFAKFQALSCFTGTGFTTRESELVTGDPQRRRIASALIVLGHAGLVTLIATFANSLRTDIIMPKLIIPVQHPAIPAKLLPVINLVVLIIALYIGYRVFTRTRLSLKLTDFIRAHIVNRGIIGRVSFEELLVATGGYGVTKIDVCENSPVINKTLLESGLRDLDVSVLAIGRGDTTIPNPPANTEILLGDKLICFGKLGTMKNKLCGGIK